MTKTNCLVNALVFLQVNAWRTSFARFENLTSTLNICGAIDGTHIPLANLLSKKVTLATSDFFNRKKFHSMVVQVVCDANKIFWNICANQPRGVHHGGQFKRCSLYAQLKSREILQKLVVIIQGMKWTPFLISDVAYPIRTYLQKNWKACKPADVEKIRYDSNINSMRVIIKNAFVSLINRWRILKHFNSKVDQTSLITIAIMKCGVHWNLDLQMQE